MTALPALPARLKDCNYNNVTNGNESNDNDVAVSKSFVDASTKKCDDGSGSQNSGNSSSRSSSIMFSAEESKKVQRLRILVYLVLFMVGVAVSTIVYVITVAGENDKFESTFLGLAEQVVYIADEIAHDKVGSISWMQSALTSYAMDRDSNWPFVTISAFQQRADTANSISGACQLTFLPIVEDADRSAWEHHYAVSHGQSFMDESLEYESQESNISYFGEDYFHGMLIDETNLTTFPILESPPDFYILDTKDLPVSKGPGPFLPVWQSSPYLPRDININVRNVPDFREIDRVIETRKATIGRFLTKSPGDSNTSMFAALLSHRDQKQVYYHGDPFGHFYLPVFKTLQKKDDVHQNRTIVGIVVLLFEWGNYFRNILHGHGEGIIMVLENPCDGAHTYEINGSEVKYLGPGDLHDTKYTNLSRNESFDDITSIRDGSAVGIIFDNEYCAMSFSVYPSQKFYKSNRTSMPLIMTMTVFVVFMFAIFMFMMYNQMVERRQRLVLNRALQSTAVVTSLFPKSVAEKLIQQTDAITASSRFSSNNTKLKSFLMDSINGNGPTGNGTTSLAELFPYTTVLFADIAGFTAWSSTREPSQVFDLLQGLYQAFDVVAKQRRVFKVETVGDSYVAVTGVPDQQEHHAVIMARFASDINQVVVRVTHDLGLKLGPGTSELRMRFGMHSGPVTAGVLRGDKARFQLFGDTVNTAARMESTGIAGKIHLSSTTAAILINSGKAHWVIPRDDMVDVKGKGIFHTYWLSIKRGRAGSVRSRNSDSENVTGGGTSNHSNPQPSMEGERDRLVRWICEMLTSHIKKLLAYRKARNEASSSFRDDGVQAAMKNRSNALHEVVEAIEIPEYKHCNDADIDAVVIDAAVMEQLHLYISTIASSYRDNPFHNFEHACHVTMSVNKLLMRIVKPDIDIHDDDGRDIGSHFYDYSYGINSDPIILLGIIFSAVIHDADHRGVSNTQMIKEEVNMAKMYEYKSIAEQNSLDIAWDLLMSNDYKVLRECLFETEDDLKRFRQVLVNLVLATDIFDKDLNDLRKQRWEKAFSNVSLSDTSKEARNIRAMIVMEHVIQASDVSHTMQHWNIYRKWNCKLFKEMYCAYKAGRMGADPSEFWYNGELGFFDNYIIPLAKKLKDCKVFGVSSDEYLNYAERNRMEWADRGREIVTEMISEMKQYELFPKLDIETIEDDDSEGSDY